MSNPHAGPIPQSYWVREGDLLARLAASNVHLSQRGPRLRVSPHIYNDTADIEAFAAALKEALA